MAIKKYLVYCDDRWLAEMHALRALTRLPAVDDGALVQIVFNEGKSAEREIVLQFVEDAKEAA